MAAPSALLRRPGVRVAVAAGVGVVSLAGFSGPATAQAPRLQGWWESTNPGGLPVAPPAAPDVPSDGLLVQAGPSGPSAYAALVYDLPADATAQSLTLQLAPGTLPSAAPTLTLCGLRQPSFAAQQGGPMSDAPAYDCGHTASAILDGSSFTFRVGSLVSDGALAVAVLPGDASTRAALAQPTDSSLTVSSGSSALVTTVPPLDSGSAASAGGDGAATQAAPPALPGLTSVPAPASVDAAAVPAAQVAPAADAATQPAVAAPAATSLAATPAAATRTAGGALRRVLLVLLAAALASAVVAWAFVGSAPEVEEATV